MTIRVLMIDDDAEDCEIVEEYLSAASTDYSFEAITDYETGRARMLDADHDVYLLDHRMGPSRGVDMLAELRKAGFNKPVILCSGNVDRDARMDAAMSGVSDILTKATLSTASLENSIKFALKRGQRSGN